MHYGTNAIVLCLALTACTTAPRFDVGAVQLAETHAPTAHTARARDPALLDEPDGAKVGSATAETPADGVFAAAFAADALHVNLTPGRFQDAGKYGPSAGESVLDLSGAVNASNDLDNKTTNTSVNLGVGVGVFLNDVIEVGLRTSGTFTIPDQGDSTVTLFGSVDVNLNLRVSRRFWLYIGPHFGFTYIEIPGSGSGAGATAASSATEPSGGGQVGARLWLTPSVSLTLEERLTYSKFTFGNVESERLDSLFRIGFTYVF